ncbi:Biotin carboxyl carrier protein of acetyl-CoA carboxylase 1 [Abeliophyllum distichum]|uniref:Biotin carboxyl carrier protein of acetyl-CoA carboxylase 1 n=1 Tax=Abeliophyllum distichum TaxID=126358 RepID=A0ABD1NTC5_9LAMI
MGLQSGWKYSSLVIAQLNVAVDGSSNAAARTPAKAEVSPEANDVNPSTDLLLWPQKNQYPSLLLKLLVLLVDSEDIVEIQLKQLDSELFICKKEALPPPPTPVTMVQSHTPPAVLPSLPTPSPASSPAPTPAPSAPEVKKSSSSLPPFKCPLLNINRNYIAHP